MTRLIDDKGRLFGKVNLVDIIVLVVIVALAVFVGLRVSGYSSDTMKNVPVKMTWIVQPADPRMLEEFLALGDLRDRDGNYMGKIESARIVDSDPLTVTMFGEDAEFKIKVAPDVIIEVSTQGTIVRDGVKVNRFAANVGGILYLVGPGWEGPARVLKVETGEAAE